MKNSNLFILPFLFLTGTKKRTYSKKINAYSNSISGTDTSLNGNTDVSTPETGADSDATNRTFTVDELKQYNGQDSKPAYVAINGIVYDVTNVKSWENGMHQGLSAGMDLTNELANSPHGDIVLTNLPVMGTLKP